MSEDALVLHDNASPHTIARIGKTLQEMVSEVLDQPAWSPEVAPTDFHLFGPPDRVNRGLRFTDDDEVKEALRECLCNQSKHLLLMVSESLWRTVGQSA